MTSFRGIGSVCGLFFAAGFAASASAAIQVQTVSTSAGAFVALDTFSYVDGSLSDTLDWAPAFEFNGTYDSSAWSPIVSADYQYRTSFESSSNRLVLENTASSSGVLSVPQSGDAVIYMNAANRQEHLVTATSNERLRLTFDFTNTGISPDFRNELLISVSSSTNAFPTFAAGFGRSDNAVSIDQPFSFEVDVLAGETISVVMEQAFVIQTVGGGLELSSWNASTHSFFSVEVIPAPGTIGSLGAAMLFAGRRRRR